MKSHDGPLVKLQNPIPVESSTTARKDAKTCRLSPALDDRAICWEAVQLTP